MTAVTKMTGVPGILRPFKEYLIAKKLAPGSHIVYYGCAGTCTPFVELLAYATRDLQLSHIFVPLFDETKARLLKNVDGAGMQIGDMIEIKPAIIVLMGGLAMPGVPVTIEEGEAVVSRHGVPVALVCFMNMFERQGWIGRIPFEMMIDATIDPVTITR